MRYVLAFLLIVGTPMAAHSQSETDLVRKAYIEAIATNPTKEQLERKARSEAVLHDLGVPVLDSLPVIADEARSTRRTSRAVAERALALMIVAVKGETRDQALVDTVIGQYDAADLFTPQEQVFIEDPEPAEDVLISMSWRYESVAVLLWSIGLIEDLPATDQIIPAGDLGNIFRQLGPEGLYAAANLRPQSELLDAADLAYRINWAATDARVNALPAPAGVDPSIAFERHYAFNWLYGYAGLAWDDMKTDI
ncbi:MAG: DUF4272 domain-containing protein [Pseudomonadota bacterium]